VSFDTPNGTRGARQPKNNGFYRLFQNRMIKKVRSKGARMRGGELLVLTTMGAKTGQERANPVMWFPAEGDGRLIVASAAGAARNPSWYYNLAAHPDRVTIEVAGEKQTVTAQQLEGDERARAWAQITATSPGFLKYESKTDRQIPVIRLTPTTH
jgi:deazaflavin-dependent oxidoreductase (nitroreductase family)